MAATALRLRFGHNTMSSKVSVCSNRCRLIRATKDDSIMCHLCCTEESESENQFYAQTGEIIKTLESPGYVTPAWITLFLWARLIFDIFKTAQQKQWEALWPSVSHKSRDSVRSWTVRGKRCSSRRWHRSFGPICLLLLRDVQVKAIRPGRARAWQADLDAAVFACLTPPYQSKRLSRH